MTKKDHIIRDLAKKYNKDVRVIQQLVNSPFKFASRVIQDPYDDRPIRLRYFAVFMQKKYDNKKNKLKDMVKTLLDDKNIGDVFVAMASTLGYSIDKVDSAKRIIKEAYENKDYEKLKDIWNAYKEYVK